MILLSMGFGVLSAVIGYWTAHFLDASIAGSMTSVLGLVFFTVYLFAPDKGLIAVLYRQKQQRTEVYLISFLLHLNNHSEEEERHLNHLQEHINWHQVRAKSVVDLALKNNMVTIENKLVTLTEKGRDFTSLALEYILTNREDKIEHIKKDFFLFRG